MTRYHEHQSYEPYSQDREFMRREGEPCRNCLYPMTEHHNGRCPKGEDEGKEST